nr:unnamed protein product [Digitaria exilis]
MPGVDLNEPINWDEVEEFEGGVLDLDYNFVWDSGNEEGITIERTMTAMTRIKTTVMQVKQTKLKKETKLNKRTSSWTKKLMKHTPAPKLLPRHSTQVVHTTQ